MPGPGGAIRWIIKSLALLRSSPFWGVRERLLIAIGTSFALALIGCSAEQRALFGSSSDSLIHGKAPMEMRGVRAPTRLTDNVAAQDGDFWNTDLSSVLSGSAAQATFDLGRETTISAAYLQGDNNDTYRLSISSDNQTFKPLWDGPPVPRPGLRTRSQTGLNASGRYLRVQALGGDGAYSLTEVQVFSETPQVFPPRPEVRMGVRQDISIRSKILLLGLGLIAYAFLIRRNSRPVWLLVGAALPLVLGWDLFRSMQESWPVEQRQISLMRGMVATVAGAVVLRELWSQGKFKGHSVATISTLAVAAALALLCFANLGRPQFFNHKENAPTFIHPFDMRVYYPVAKYFNELRFDGVYLASVLAYVEDQPGMTLAQVGSVEYRDLTNHQMVRAGEQLDQIQKIKTRFSAERWEAFKLDMRYFRESMGAGDYLGSMRDHGGNATPVWLAIAHLIFAGTTANNLSLGVGALLDPVLLLVAFGMIGWVFGIRTALVSAVIFGANDYYMFGTNWAGATLRHDWMAYLAFGACALKKGWYKSAGIFLALASLIRAFPAMALFGASVPALFWAYNYYRREGRLPGIGTIRQAQKQIITVALSAAATLAFFLLFTSMLFGAEAWPEWLHKVHLLSKDPHVNHVSLKAAVAGSEFMQASTVSQRMPLYLACVAFFVGAVVFTARRRPMHQAAMLGLILIPVAFYPANYYIHFIFLLPLVATELNAKTGPPLSSEDGTIWLSALGICAAQYFTTLDPDLDRHFYMASVILFAGFAVFLLGLIRGEQKEQAALASQR